MKETICFVVLSFALNFTANSFHSTAFHLKHAPPLRAGFKRFYLNCGGRLEERITEEDPGIVRTSGAGGGQCQESCLGRNRYVHLLNNVPPRRIAQVKTNDAIQNNPDIGGTELSLGQVLWDAAHGGKPFDPDI